MMQLWREEWDTKESKRHTLCNPYPSQVHKYLITPMYVHTNLFTEIETAAPEDDFTPIHSLVGAYQTFPHSPSFLSLFFLAHYLEIFPRAGL